MLELHQCLKDNSKISQDMHDDIKGLDILRCRQSVTRYLM